MNQAQDFGIGDRVWWYYDNSQKSKNSGVVEEIEGDLMNIWEDWVTECHVSIVALRTERGWLVHRPYEGYKELLYKD